MPQPSTLIPIFFAILASIYLVLAIRTPRRTSVGPHPARRASIRISMILYAVSIFLFYWSRSI
jgi:hypothetical protein